MKADVIKLSKAKAEKLYNQYNEALAKKNYAYIKDMKSLYYQLKKGKKIIDIFEAFKTAGVNEKDQPKLAIARADQKEVSFRGELNGSGSFCKDRFSSNIQFLPSGTYDWNDKEAHKWYGSWMKTKVPVIPAHLLPSGALSRYFIIFETDKWEEVTSDPLLVRRITKNLFVVLGAWDLSPLEKALVRGR